MRFTKERFFLFHNMDFDSEINQKPESSEQSQNEKENKPNTKDQENVKS